MASGRTAIRSLPYPNEGDAPDVAGDIASLAEALDTRPAVGVGALADRPAPSAPGNRYFVYGDSTAANNGVEWLDTGGSWILAPWASSVGDVKLWAGPADPVDADGVTRWNIMDGRAISRTTYAVAFARLGTTFGAGDGSTTFNIPDTRGKVIIGAGQGSGLTNRAFAATGGEETHLLTSGESGVAPHDHAISDPKHSHGTEVPGNTTETTAYESGFNNFTETGSVVGTTDPASTNITVENAAAANAANAHNNMPPFLVLNHIIKIAV